MANPPEAGPIIVHCSAGVGRTGAYIVLDAMLRQIKARGDLNVHGYLQFIRRQRNFLVQTEEQYIFIHDALVEAIERYFPYFGNFSGRTGAKYRFLLNFSGDTNVSRSYFPRYVQKLLASYADDEKCNVITSLLLEHQFKLVTQLQLTESQTSAALKVYNLTKNRNLDCVCTDSHRVMMSPRPGVDGADYINASFLPGYHRLQEFILTQHPLESTVPDFWQMIWDRNVRYIVLLSQVDDQEYLPFWPLQHEDLDLDNVRVKLLSETDRVGCVLRDFSLLSLQDDYEMTVKLVQCSHWPFHHDFSSNSSNSSSNAGGGSARTTSPPGIFDLIQLMLKSIVSETYSGSIAVIDRSERFQKDSICLENTMNSKLKPLFAIITDLAE